MNGRKILGLLLFLSALSLYASPVNLGTADSFAVLAYSTVTNTGPSVVFGNLGVSAGTLTSITGFFPGTPLGPGTVLGTQHGGDAAAQNAHIDALAAYNYLAGLTPTMDLSATPELGGRLLSPGVYFFSSSAQLTGTLTLDLQNNPDSLFVFQIGSALTTAPGSSVVFTNGADCCNVFWQVGSAATLDTTTDFRGTIIANAAITLNNGATIRNGRALSLGAAVTLDNNIIDNRPCVVPEPGTLPLFGAGLVGLVLLGRASRKRAA